MEGKKYRSGVLAGGSLPQKKIVGSIGGENELPRVASTIEALPRVTEARLRSWPLAC